MIIKSESFEADLELAKRYLALKDSARQRNLEFNLTLKHFKKLINSKKCYYTGKKLIYKNNFSIDRVDNTKGYIIGNVVACDKEFNSLKANLSIEVINLLYIKINKFYK